MQNFRQTLSSKCHCREILGLRIDQQQGKSQVKLRSSAIAIATAVFLAQPASAQDDAEMRAAIAEMRAQMAEMASRIATLEGDLAQAEAQAQAANSAATAASEAAAEATVAAADAKSSAPKISWKGGPKIEGKGGWSFKPRGRLQYDAGLTNAPSSTGPGNSWTSLWNSKRSSVN